MRSYSDFEEMLLALNAANVKYLVIGAYALAIYARPRATSDIDLWVEPTTENAVRVFRALAVFGAPMEQLSETTFCEPDTVFQMAVPPVRMDILTGIDGVTFGAGSSHRPDRLGSQ